MIKKFLVVASKKNISNKELAEELHEPIIRKFSERKIHSHFVDNIQGADLANQVKYEQAKAMNFIIDQ